MNHQLQAAIDKYVKPEDLIDLTTDEFVYVAKCTHAAIERCHGSKLGVEFSRNIAEARELEEIAEAANRCGAIGVAFRLLMKSFDLELESAVGL